MKIIPVVTESGIHYEVRKKVLFGKRYLAEKGYWSDLEDRFDREFAKPMEFVSPELAADEIRVQFGQQAKIERWEPNQ